LTYKLEDDYGVVGAQATFSSLNSDAGNRARALYEAPNFPLVLPQARTRNGTGQTIKDLTEHPWAGADVAMTLTARDEAGNEGRSEPFEMRLPERPFSKPVARALIEQRRLLALDGDAQANVLTALDALTLAPERFHIEASVYLGLRSIFWQLSRAKSDDQLREVVDRMWDMAVHIEDGSVSDAEQAMRAAEEALRQALERGASDEEIKKLTDQLRAALDKFMQALAEQMRRNPQQLARPLDPNMRQLRPQDLRSMIDRLEQLSRSGAKDAARRMLQELQSMLENLQMARPGQQMDDGDDDMMSALDELGDMIRKQQQLRDRTFQQGQDQRRDRMRGQRGQQGQGQQGQEQQPGNQMGELRENQQSLRDQLKKLMEELRKRGFGQGQQGQGELDQLGRAGEAMGDAEGELGEGNADSAVESQGRALEALRRGAQNLAQSMQQQGMIGPGPNGQPGRLGPARAQQDTDPLGRPLRGRDYGDDNAVRRIVGIASKLGPFLNEGKTMLRRQRSRKLRARPSGRVPRVGLADFGRVPAIMIAARNVIPAREGMIRWKQARGAIRACGSALRAWSRGAARSYLPHRSAFVSVPHRTLRRGQELVAAPTFPRAAADPRPGDHLRA